jgi:hypothetical protein
MVSGSLDKEFESWVTESMSETSRGTQQRMSFGTSLQEIRGTSPTHFVSFDSSDDAETAISELDGQDLGGRTLKVSIAHERERNNRSNGRRDRRRDG